MERKVANKATLTVQQWGNSLAVRIPAAVARSAGVRLGQPVEVTASDSDIFVRTLGKPRLSLAQKLSAFDPEMHAGESMETGRVGREVF
jgi:antitoxin MazE